MVALPGGMGQVTEQRDFWSHAKGLPWGLWESVLQQEAQQEGSDGGRQAGKAHLLLGVLQRGKLKIPKLCPCFAILGQPALVSPGQLSSELPRCGLCWGRWPGGLESPPLVLAGARLGGNGV